MNDAALHILRTKFAAKKKAARLSLRDIAAAAGTTASSLSRFQNGKPSDIDTILKVAAWVEIDPGEIFGGNGAAVRDGRPALEGIKDLILSDESIEENRRADLWRWFEQTYGTFTKIGD